MLTKFFNLTTVAGGIAAGLLIAGALALAGGLYAKDVVHDQLTPQNIVFPQKGKELPTNLNQYAGQKVDTGKEAEAYANDFIGLHLQQIGGGKSYSEISAAYMADPKNEELAQTRQTMFMGTMLRTSLLNAWGWAKVGSYAVIAGIALLGIGGLLLVAPVASFVADRRRRTAPVKTPDAAPSAA